MEITDVRHRLLYLPFDKPRRWAGGERPGMTRLFVEVDTNEGITGYGESIALLDFVPVVFERLIAPLAIGEDPHNTERIYRKAEGAGFYHHKRAMVAALAGLDMALWDVIGKAAGVPIHQLWGGAYRTRVPTSGLLHIAEPGAMARQAQGFVAAGWSTIKVKLGLGLREDIATVETVRNAIGTNIELRADPNGAWTPGTARRAVRLLEPFDLQYVEQPLVHDDLAGHVELRKVSRIPICLDESAYTNADVISIIRAGAADVLLIDGHEAGGWWQARKQAAIAEAAGIPVGFHCAEELGLSTAAHLHLAAASPNVSVAIDSVNSIMPDDIITERFEYVNGDLAVPQNPGLGVNIDFDKVERYAVERVQPHAYGVPERPDWFPVKPSY